MCEEAQWLHLSTLRAVQTEVWQAKQIAIAEALRSFESLWHEMARFEKEPDAISTDAEKPNVAQIEWEEATHHAESLFLPIDEGDHETLLACTLPQRHSTASQTDAGDHEALLAALAARDALQASLDERDQVAASERAVWEKQKALLEKEKRASQLLPTRKERQEILILRTELEQQAQRHREEKQKLCMITERLKDQLQHTKRRNDELLEEVALLESRLLKASPLKQHHASSDAQSYRQEHQVLEHVLRGKGGQRTSQAAPRSKAEKSGSSYTSRPLSTASNLQMSAGAQQDGHLAPLVSEMMGKNGRIERRYEDGAVIYIFANGTTKEVLADGQITFNYCNGDTKQIMPDGLAIYHFFGAKTSQITQPDGVIIYKFGNGQMETHYQDGAKTIEFPDGTTKQITAQ